MIVDLPPSLPAPTSSPGADLGGLVALAGRKEVGLPLTEVRVRTRVAGSLAHTVVEQRFANTLDRPMEAVHIFPLPPNGAVTELELCCGDLTVKAQCRERGEAERRFETARRDGHRAALLTAERADVHTLRVTNLPPGEEVRVRLVLVEQLEAEDGCLRLRFPTVVAPRYMPGEASGQSGVGTTPDTDRVPDASRLSPHLRLEGGTRLDLEVEFAGVPARLESSLHALKLAFDGGLRVAPSGDATCDRDFVLAFAYEPGGGMRAWTDGIYTLAVVEPPMVAATVMPRDAVFVVDISGSMTGSKLRAAKKALRTALRGLVGGDRFMLLAFDDRVESFAEQFTPYDEAALQRAEKWVSRLESRGGTEMLAPIKLALDGDRPAGRLRTVLFITDGQAGNDQEVVAAVANRANGARFFPLGIDTAVNAALLERLARVGGGACTLCTPSDDIEAVVARVEARFGSPVADGLRVEGDAANPAPRTLFAGMPVSLVVKGAPSPVVATAGTHRWTAEPVRVATSLSPLWARARVHALEDRLVLKPLEEEALRPEILRVALEAQIASRFTAFVAVETTRRVSGEPVEVVVPVELPAQWELSSPMPMVCASPAPPPYGAAPTGSRGRAKSASPGGFFAAAARALAGGPIQGAFDAGGASGGPAEFDDDGIDAMRAPAPARPAARPAASPPRPGTPGPGNDPGVQAAALAATQAADGSWGGQLDRTCAALLALVLLGHTRTRGLRKRAVAKAAAWLAGRTEPVAASVLAVLDAAERGETPNVSVHAALRGAGPEGAVLASAWVG